MNFIFYDWPEKCGEVLANEKIWHAIFTAIMHAWCDFI